MKGIVLAGGKGTRLYPATLAFCKQLLPIYDKPMIYYPISLLMLAGIKDILIISTEKDILRFQELFQDGGDFGLNISYAVQKEPKGISEAFIIGESFIKDDSVCLVLGDNIIYGQDFSKILSNCSSLTKGGIIFGYRVKDPTRYGVVEFSENFDVISIEEKPKYPKSFYAIPGLYFFDNNVVNIAKTIKPSKRGELEITEIHNAYLKENLLKVIIFGKGYAWLDAGTFEDFQKASLFYSDYSRSSRNKDCLLRRNCF